MFIFSPVHSTRRTYELRSREPKFQPYNFCSRERKFHNSSLTNRVAHFCKCNVEADLLKQATPHMVILR